MKDGTIYNLLFLSIYNRSFKKETSSIIELNKDSAIYIGQKDDCEKSKFLGMTAFYRYTEVAFKVYIEDIITNKTTVKYCHDFYEPKWLAHHAVESKVHTAIELLNIFNDTLSAKINLKVNVEKIENEVLFKVPNTFDVIIEKKVLEAKKELLSIIKEYDEQQKQKQLKIDNFKGV